MAVPRWDEMTLPALRAIAEYKNGTIRPGEITDCVADALGLSEEDRKELLPSGYETRLHNRVTWACQYLKRAEMVNVPRRGHYQITDEGRRVLATNPTVIDLDMLRQYEGVREFIKPRVTGLDGNGGNSVSDIDPDPTPEETIEVAYATLRKQLIADLLQQIKAMPPDFFERLVVELLVKMGYGGNLRDAGMALGRSGDGGVDGVIKEDRLGLDTIYVQAKRYDGTSVGRPEIQAFVGALQGFRARKGVFFTTSVFTSDARTYAEGIDVKVILLDGQTVAGYMIDFGLGVTTTNTYEIKRIDSDYFDEG